MYARRDSPNRLVYCLINMKYAFFSLLVFTTWTAAEVPDLRSVPPDLEVPALRNESPAPGNRVKQTLEPWKDTKVYHVIYLPTDWKPDAKLPVIVELAGNEYQDKYGNISTGRPEGSKLGYGLSAGRGFIWLCVPYLNGAGNDIAVKWWGDAPLYDPQPTLKYLREVVKSVCREFGGNESKVILCGFSRGAIACNYLGLHDDETAKLWCGFVAYSHYDGVIETWPYPGADRKSAAERLKRLGNRPQFICGQESGQIATEKYLKPLLPEANLTFATVGFRNHNDAWVLRPSEARDQARKWIEALVSRP
jgi:hypothetical protein